MMALGDAYDRTFTDYSLTPPEVQLKKLLGKRILATNPIGFFVTLDRGCFVFLARG